MTHTSASSRFARHIAAAVLAAPLVFASLVAQPATAAEFVSIVKEGVNMRSGPGTRHESQWLLSKGYPLKVTARSGRWLQVTDMEHDKGWIYRPLTSKRPHHVVKADTANVRKGPSTKHAIVGKAYYGEIVRTLERRRNWVKVQREDGPGGWIARNLLWGW